MLKLNRKATMKEIVSSSLLAGAIMLSLFGIASAITNYPPGALLQPNDVTSSHIRDNTIVNADISASAAFTFASSSIYTLNAGAFVASSTASLPATTTFNGVSYHFPTADGASGQIFTTSGTQQLSWSDIPAPTNDLFGTVADGSYTLDGTQAAVGGLFSKSGNTYTLLRDAYFNTLQVDSGITLNTNGYAIWAGTAVVNAGTIQNLGGNGGNGTAATAGVAGTGGTAGAGAAAGSLAGGVNGKAGANGILGANAGTAGTAGSALNPSLCGNGSAGGAGGTYTANTGGAAGGAGTGTTETLKFLTDWPVLPLTVTNAGTDTVTLRRAMASSTVSGITLSNCAGSGSGGSGGAAGGAESGGGGGSGGNGGAMFIATATITNTGTISTKGGNGGNGGGGGRAGSGGDGGGAGGGGGTLVLVYKTLTNSGTITTAGGSGGTGSAGNLGESGGNGTAGPTGAIYKIAVTL